MPIPPPATRQRFEPFRHISQPRSDCLSDEQLCAYAPNPLYQQQWMQLLSIALSVLAIHLQNLYLALIDLALVPALLAFGLAVYSLTLLPRFSGR